MKYGINKPAYSFVFIASLISCSQLSGLYHPRQLGRLADTINKSNGNLIHKQQALATTFKNTITNSKATFKPIILQKVVTAAARNSRLKYCEIQKKCIENAIDEFHGTPGFLTLLHRLVTGIVWHNTANFNGAMAEVCAALEKRKQQKIILALR